MNLSSASSVEPSFVLNNFTTLPRIGCLGVPHGTGHATHGNPGRGHLNGDRIARNRR